MHIIKKIQNQELPYLQMILILHIIKVFILKKKKEDLIMINMTIIQQMVMDQGYMLKDMEKIKIGLKRMVIQMKGNYVSWYQQICNKFNCEKQFKCWLLQEKDNFSDKSSICLYYAPYTEYCGIFMSRFNTEKIRQSQRMKKFNYFVINNSENVRPYRILLYVKK
ncbi:unnamed protein product [Paramecium sonneborni]|uniref:Uncharacterized protein n=1 Tax=Paramecium sonneborni TaxID=65129 RepID=A0A8S1RW69_9CILI|nr:unnamed protein product [Paramecium sonneborni]